MNVHKLPSDDQEYRFKIDAYEGPEVMYTVLEVETPTTQVNFFNVDAVDLLTLQNLIGKRLGDPEFTGRPAVTRLENARKKQAVNEVLDWLQAQDVACGEIQASNLTTIDNVVDWFVDLLHDARNRFGGDEE